MKTLLSRHPWLLLLILSATLWMIAVYLKLHQALDAIPGQAIFLGDAL
jgi:hypothetical protein